MTEEEEIKLLKTIFIPLYKFEVELFEGFNRLGIVIESDDNECRHSYMDNDNWLRLKWHRILDKINSGVIISKEFETARRNYKIDKII